MLSSRHFILSKLHSIFPSTIDRFALLYLLQHAGYLVSRNQLIEIIGAMKERAQVVELQGENGHTYYRLAEVKA